MKKALVILVSLLCVTATLLACGPAAQTTSSGTAASGAAVSSSEPVKVGLIVTNAWAIGKSAAQGLKLWVSKVNKNGGVGGRQVELIVEDSKMQVAIGVEKYRKLVVTDKCAIVIVADPSSIVTACAESGKTLYKEYPHLLFNPGASAEAISKMMRSDYESYKFFFTPYSTGPDRFIYGAWIETYLTEHVVKPKPTKIAVIGEDIPEYNQYWNGWTEYNFPPYPDVVYKSRGMEVVYTGKIAMGEKMFLPIFEKIAESGAEYIDFHMSAYSDAYTMAKQWAQSAAKDIPFHHTGASPKYWEITNGACLGMIGTWPSDFVDLEVNTMSKEFLQEFNKTYGFPGCNWMGMGSYDSALMWAAAVEKTKSFDIYKLIPELENEEVQGLRGILKVNPKDHISHNYPYPDNFAENTVKLTKQGFTAEEMIKYYKDQGQYPYGIYPYGTICPLSQWQENGKLVVLHPQEVAQKTNPTSGYVSPKELRERQAALSTTTK